MPEFTSVVVTKGPGGWGGPLTITPDDARPLVASLTGGGVHPVAQRIADLSGGEVVDGFAQPAPFERIAVAVIDCGGTARAGVYPMKKVPTVDIHPTRPGGPLSRHVTADIFVSGVGVDDVATA